MGSARRNVLRVVVVGLCFALAACGKPAPPPGGASGGKAEKARKDAEALALGGVNGGAKAQAEAMPELAVHRPLLGGVFGKSVPPKGGKPAPLVTPPDPVVKGPPAPKSPARPGGPALVVRERIVSTVPYATEADAEEDTLAQARELVEKKLAELDPPMRHKVSANEVQHEFLRKDSRTVRRPDDQEKEAFAQYGVTGDLVYVEYDVEVTADQVRELRSQERVAGGLRVLGILIAFALAGFLFLRADEWTRGYLTTWLALCAAVLAGGSAAALVFV